MKSTLSTSFQNAPLIFISMHSIPFMKYVFAEGMKEGMFYLLDFEGLTDFDDWRLNARGSQQEMLERMFRSMEMYVKTQDSEKKDIPDHVEQDMLRKHRQIVDAYSGNSPRWWQKKPLLRAEDRMRPWMPPGLQKSGGYLLRDGAFIF
jgi:hypothetical protein